MRQVAAIVVESAPMLPAKGPWEHAYYDIPDAHVDVTFVDDEGRNRTVGIRHKVIGAGNPLVLVHGLMTSSYSWRFVLADLAKDYRVFAPDLVGSGASDKPVDLRYSVANMARFVAAYVRTVVQEPVYLVANSLGGLYSLRMLLDAPELVRRFIMMHSPGFPLVRTAFSSLMFRTPGLGAAARSFIARVAHARPDWFIAKNVHYARTDMMSQEECREYGRIFDTLEHARVFAKILDQSLTATEHAAIVARLATWTPPFPMELLWARKDVMVPPSFGPKYAAAIPKAKLVWMDDVSHFLHCDAPERVTAEIRRFDGE